jgi:hypothetical protein
MRVLIKEAKILALLYPVAGSAKVVTWVLKQKYGVIR